MQRKRFIVHVDMDAFFAAIEERDNPNLRGKPVVVGADPKGGRGRGVVSASSYEARRLGIHSAMPISTAYRKCPHAVFLPVNMEKYRAVAHQIYRILYDFTPDIEPVSIDEAFLDITGSYRLFGTPLECCLSIKSRIRCEMGLTASVGLAPTKMAAKIASDLNKPDGMVEVAQEGLRDFLWPLDIRKIWGLGEKSAVLLNDMGTRTIGELAARDVVELIDLFGANGAHFWELANGIDEREVSTEKAAKSISNETTFDEDSNDNDKIEGAIIALCEKVSSRLRREGLKAKTITLKIRLEGFHTYTRSITMDRFTNFIDELYEKTKQLYSDFDRKGKRVRLVGLKASNMSSADFTDDLFGMRADEKMDRMHQALDKIKQRFGDDAIYRAASIKREPTYTPGV